ncbi:winged helix-turn-helix transcriptional regulator [Streptomyces sp. NPDC058457]|uniref:winged helix-turn-helix transcriptional regulator n=1 Tax=Streptomyces sp. NPDC058457 TaxID=3346507 RepID=UPI0036463469
MTPDGTPLTRTEQANLLTDGAQSVSDILTAEYPTAVGRSQDLSSRRDDHWAVVGDRWLVALEAVETGGVRFRRTAIGEDLYVSWEKAQRQGPAIWPQTVQRLVADGLLHQDTSEGLYQPGQLLSLTPQGEAALRDARETTPRHSAALSRSTTSGDLRHPRPPSRRARRLDAQHVLPLPLAPSRQDASMPTPAQAPAFSIGSIDAQRVEEALAWIGPKWTTWSAMILARENRPMRVRDVAAQLPFVSEQFVGKRLATMHADGLVVRDDDRRGAPYRLSALGGSLPPVLRTVSDWSRAYLPLGRMAEAERVEDALRRLNLRHATAVIQVLDSGGPMRFVHIAEEASLDSGITWHRLLRLQADGLVARTGSRHGDPYVLTDAGHALGAVFTSVEHWSEPVALRRASSAPRPAAAATRTHVGVPLGADGARASVALRRSTTAPNALFSHAPQPQPRVPATVAAQSAPGRGR